MANQIPFRRVAIVGTGLIGGSFGLALHQQFPEITRIGYDHPETLERALGRGAVDEASPDLATAVCGADLVYIALPVVPAIEHLAAIATSAGPHSLVTDACSTKAIICESARKYFRSGARFLGGHPMAGKEHCGISHADAELFRRAPYALIESEDDTDERVQNFVELLRSTGAIPTWYDAETHDWAVGIVSHLPQLLAVALARVVQDETDETGLPLALSGQGLQDMLRLAGSPYSIWRDILLTNASNVVRSLDRLSQAIDYLRTHLTSKEIEQEFRTANELYKLLRKP